MTKLSESPALEEALRTGKKRMSTFAAALADAYEGDPYEGPSGRHGDHANHAQAPRPPRKPADHKYLGRTAEHTDRPLVPVERSRERKNSYLRQKLKTQREKLRAEEEAHEAREVCVWREGDTASLRRPIHYVRMMRASELNF